MMARRWVIISTLIVLSAGLIAVPSIGLLSQGCQAGTKGLLEWLPESWDGRLTHDPPCNEARDLLSEGYKALCPADRQTPIKHLLDTIGFFGSSSGESEELAVCKYSKSAWSWFTTIVSGGRDATLDFHHAVTEALGKNSISVQNLLASSLENVELALWRMGTITEEIGRQVSEPILAIPQKFMHQSSQWWEFYRAMRAPQDTWTFDNSYSNASISSEVSAISGAIKAGDWKHVRKSYLTPFWEYITCDIAKPKVKKIILAFETDDHKLSIISSGEDMGTTTTTVTGPSEAQSGEDENWETVTRGLVSKMLEFMTKSPVYTAEGPGDVSGEEEKLEVIMEVPEVDVDKVYDDVVEIEEDNMLGSDSPMPPDQLTNVDPIQVSDDDMYSRSLKKVLLESLIACVVAFTLFILGVIFHRMVSSKMFGFKWPTLFDLVRSRYKPVRLIKSAQHFNTFHMECRRTRQNVAVKCLQSSSSDSARASFRTELQSLKRLQHPNVITLLDCIRAGPSFCLGMEYAAYGNLRCAVQTPVKPFGFAQKIAVYGQVLEAVNWMHKSGWAHLNIHPGSVLVFDQWSQVKLSGFTQAVELHYGEKCYNYNLHPMCSSPHVITSQAYDPQKADLWALGCLLYFIFTQREVHDAQGALRLARVVSLMDFERRPAYGLNLLKMLADLLSFHPDNRPHLAVLMDTVNNLG